MPFQSEKQRRYLHANHPEIAKRWEKEYAYGGLLSLGNESIVDTTEEGNDISLVDDTSQGIERMFVKKGGRIGFRVGSGEGKDVSGREYGGGNVSASNPNEDRAREERSAPTPREVGIQQAYEVTGPAVAKERQRQAEADLAFSRSPASDIEKYDTWDQQYQDIPGTSKTSTYKSTINVDYRRDIYEKALAKQKARMKKMGLSKLIMPALLIAMGIPASLALKGITVNPKDLMTAVQYGLPVAEAKKELIAALEDSKAAYLQGVDINNPNEMKNLDDTAFPDVMKELKELTKLRDEDDTGGEGPSVAPVTDEIEESTTYAWDMFTPRDQLKKAAYLDKLEEQAAALNPNKDDLIGEETSGLADLFTVKTQQ